MTVEAWITTVAIFLGPLLAVVITNALQQSRELRQRRLHVFRTLMTTRKTPLSPDRVEALNLVEVEFAGKSRVLRKFSELLSIYNDQVKWKANDERIIGDVVQQVDDKSAEMLREMGLVLGYKLENLELLRGGYYPEAFSVLEKQQMEIREFLLGLSSGAKAMPISVIDVRHSEQLLKQAREMHLLLSEAERSEKDRDKDV